MYESFRCGLCGQPTDINGAVLTIDEIKEMDVDGTKLIKLLGIAVFLKLLKLKYRECK